MSFEVNVQLRDIGSGNPNDYDFIEQFCQKALSELEGKINVSVIEGTPVTVNLVVDTKKKTPTSAGGGGEGLPPDVKLLKDIYATIRKLIRQLNKSQEFITSLKKADKKELATQLQKTISSAEEVAGQL